MAIQQRMPGNGTAQAPSGPSADYKECKVSTMLFMIRSTISPEHSDAAVERFKQRGAPRHPRA